MLELKDYSIDLLEEHLKFEKNMDRYFTSLDDRLFYVTPEEEFGHMDELKELKERMDRIEEDRSSKNKLFCQRYAGIQESKNSE